MLIYYLLEKLEELGMSFTKPEKFTENQEEWMDLLKPVSIS
jgi:hypothetical protein